MKRINITTCAKCPNRAYVTISGKWVCYEEIPKTGDHRIGRDISENVDRGTTHEKCPLEETD
jgi:hypothetical protein